MKSKFAILRFAGLVLVASAAALALWIAVRPAVNTPDPTPEEEPSTGVDLDALLAARRSTTPTLAGSPGRPSGSDAGQPAPAPEAGVQSPTVRIGPRSDGEDRGEYVPVGKTSLARVAKELDLTDPQERQIRALLREENEAIGALLAGEGRTAEDFWREAEEVRGDPARERSFSEGLLPILLSRFVDLVRLGRTCQWRIDEVLGTESLRRRYRQYDIVEQGLSALGNGQKMIRKEDAESQASGR